MCTEHTRHFTSGANAPRLGSRWQPTRPGPRKAPLRRSAGAAAARRRLVDGKWRTLQQQRWSPQMSKQRLQQLQTCCLHTRDAQQHRCCNHAAASKLRRQRTHCTQVSIPVGRDTLVPARRAETSRSRRRQRVRSSFAARSALFERLASRWNASRACALRETWQTRCPLTALTRGGTPRLTTALSSTASSSASHEE